MVCYVLDIHEYALILIQSCATHFLAAGARTVWNILNVANSYLFAHIRNISHGGGVFLDILLFGKPFSFSHHSLVTGIGCRGFMFFLALNKQMLTFYLSLTYQIEYAKRNEAKKSNICTSLKQFICVIRTISGEISKYTAYKCMETSIN